MARGAWPHTYAYLLRETGTDELFKDPAVLQRLKEMSALSQKDKDCIIYNLDAVLRDVKTRQAYVK